MLWRNSSASVRLGSSARAFLARSTARFASPWKWAICAWRSVASSSNISRHAQQGDRLERLERDLPLLQLHGHLGELGGHVPVLHVALEGLLQPGHLDVATAARVGRAGHAVLQLRELLAAPALVLVDGGRQHLHRAIDVAEQGERVGEQHRRVVLAGLDGERLHERLDAALLLAWRAQVGIARDEQEIEALGVGRGVRGVDEREVRELGVGADGLVDLPQPIADREVARRPLEGELEQRSGLVGAAGLVAGVGELESSGGLGLAVLEGDDALVRLDDTVHVATRLRDAGEHGERIGVAR